MDQNEFDNILPSLIQGRVENNKFLLAVSGGVDSMCMASFFLNSRKKLQFGVAHVNFSLRGEESDLDEILVKEWAKENGIDFYTVRFDTKAYARQNSISTQMAARDLRYEWFYKVMDENGYDYLAVAHNQNDSVETLFLNLLRGSGVRGLAGIKRVNGRIIRPILSMNRERILEYARANEIRYRDDITNFESHYARNRIRNIIFPEFQKINPSFLNTVYRNTGYITQAIELLEEVINAKRGDLFNIDGELLTIDIEKLKREKNISFWLFGILGDYGFNNTHFSNIETILNGQSGKTFFSATHEMILDRGVIKVYPLEKGEVDSIFITEPGIYTCCGTTFKFDLFIRPDKFKPTVQSGQLFFDAEKIKFPMLCRGWKEGDRFRPFGMEKGSKKLSDLFTDLKMDKREKERQPIIMNGEHIVCLPGLRIDDHYKVRPSTKIIAEVIIED